MFIFVVGFGIFVFFNFFCVDDFKVGEVVLLVLVFDCVYVKILGLFLCLLIFFSVCVRVFVCDIGFVSLRILMWGWFDEMSGWWFLEEGFKFLKGCSCDCMLLVWFFVKFRCVFFLVCCLVFNNVEVSF